MAPGLGGRLGINNSQTTWLDRYTIRPMPSATITSAPNGTMVNSDPDTDLPEIVVTATLLDFASLTASDWALYGTYGHQTVCLGRYGCLPYNQGIEEVHWEWVLFGGGIRAAAGSQSRSVWALGNFERGRVIERLLGANLPKNFPTIDRFSDGVATSIKSIDFGAATYQNLAKLGQKLNGYVDKVAGYAGTKSWGGTTVDASQIAARQLHLAVPSIGSPAQQAVLNATILRAQGLGVEVRVTVVP